MVNFLSLSLSLSRHSFVSLSHEKNNFAPLLFCFAVRLSCSSPFSLLSRTECLSSFSCSSSSLFLPPRKRESVIYLHLSNDDDDAFFFREDSPNGGGRYYQGTLLFLLFQILSLRFCCCRRLRRLVRILRSLFVCLGAEILFNG